MQLPLLLLQLVEVKGIIIYLSVFILFPYLIYRLIIFPTLSSVACTLKPRENEGNIY